MQFSPSDRTTETMHITICIHRPREPSRINTALLLGSSPQSQTFTRIVLFLLSQYSANKQQVVKSPVPWIHPAPGAHPLNTWCLSDLNTFAMRRRQICSIEFALLRYVCVHCVARSALRIRQRETGPNFISAKLEIRSSPVYNLYKT